MTVDANDFPYKGQCLCGSVKYEVADIVPRIAHCHCSMCRKFHGAAFGTYGSAKAENFRWLSGEALLKTYRADNATHRTFCGNCGSSLIFAAESDLRDFVVFALGTLDTDIELRPMAHIYTDHGANWYEITDDLMQLADGEA